MDKQILENERDLEIAKKALVDFDRQVVMDRAVLLRTVVNIKNKIDDETHANILAELENKIDSLSVKVVA